MNLPFLRDVRLCGRDDRQAGALDAGRLDDKELRASLAMLYVWHQMTVLPKHVAAVIEPAAEVVRSNPESSPAVLQRVETLRVDIPVVQLGLGLELRDCASERVITAVVDTASVAFAAARRMVVCPALMGSSAISRALVCISRLLCWYFLGRSVSQSPPPWRRPQG